MGGCFNKCCGESSNQDDPPNERTVLIDEQSVTSPTESNHEDALPYRGAAPTKPDEQSVMNKILSETATNVIDVADLGPHTMEQNDFLDRKELYANLLRPHLGAPWVHGAQQKCILLDIPDPERVLSAPPVSTVEYCLLETITVDVAKALETLAVRHKEDLIVPFQIP